MFIDEKDLRYLHDEFFRHVFVEDKIELNYNFKKGIINSLVEYVAEQFSNIIVII